MVRHIEVKKVSESSPVVLIEYADLLDNNADFSAVLDTGFGKKGLGILVVKDVPRFPELRKRLLPLAHKFANFDSSVKAKYEDATFQYQFGWSHGKENLQGKPDYRKGSYYNNPVYDLPFEDVKIQKEFPSFAAPNIWPKEDLPELEFAFKDLGGVMIETGVLLAKHIDNYCKSKSQTYPDNRLSDIIVNSRTAKGRLLHYFPPDYPIPGEEGCNSCKQESSSDFASWCGWHNDHGSLTALCSAMYIDRNGNEVANPNPENGLYIKDRLGNVVRAMIPPDCLAFQLGETHQIHSGGLLQATPHCVHASSDPKVGAGVSRQTFAVFMEPMMFESMDVPKGVDPELAKEGSSHKFLPPGVPELGIRWNSSMNFAQFTKATLDAYTVY